ncbi:DUF2029 domain-containing protein [Winogradskya humida]|uniref:Glycosyl transferase n=1 Tax=Winogradskya humida TaxID=113566 RepID=A0ABQ4A6Z5_9ACTN|nr:DUF2029 domain-containing protein [Actinoplanes humidus]GIE26408.1 glycosyl transferase [Actinoplanes humidus]
MTAQPTLITDAPEAADTDASGPEPDGPAERRRRWPWHVGAALIYIVVGMVAMGNWLEHPNETVSSHLANDNTWFQWLLTHGAYSIQHFENPLFSTRQNYPTGVNMMANTSVLGVTLPLAPLTIWLGARVTYLIWMIGALAGTAFAAYYVLQRWVVRSPIAAFLGGAFAGFAPGIVHHANGQPNFASNFALPFLILMVFRLGINGRWLRDGVILGLLVVYQVFINEEMLVAIATGCVVAVLAWAVLSPRMAWRRAKAFLLGATVTAVVAGALLAYPLWFQFKGPQTFEALPLYHSWGEDIATYFYFSRDTIWGDPIVEKTMGYPEQNSWFGWPLTIVVAVAFLVLIWRNLIVRVAFVAGVILAIMSMGPKIRWNGTYTTIPGPWHYIPDDLPVLGLLTPSRLTFTVVGVFAIMVALAFDAAARVRERKTILGRGASVIAGLLVIAALVPLIPKPLPAKEDPMPPEFITSGAWKPYVPAGRSLIPLPVPNRFPIGRENLGWAAWTQDFPIPEGYFLGPGKDGHGQPGADWSRLTWLVNKTVKDNKVPKVSDKDKTQVQSDIARYEAGVLVVRNEPRYDNVRILVEDLMGRAPEQNLDVWIWPIA